MATGAPRRIGPESLSADRALARASAILQEIRPGDPAVVSWCDLHTPAVIVGRGAGEPPISWDACAEHGLSVHRRSSGGGVVIWDPELVAVDIVLPSTHPLLEDDVVQAYRWVGVAMAEALQGLGLNATLIDVGSARAASRNPLLEAACFGTLSPWEVTVDGRKVVGLSQVRRREGGIIQVGVPLRVDIDLLAAVIDGSDDQIAPLLAQNMAGVQDFRPSVAREQLMDAMGDALEAGLGAPMVTAPPNSREHAAEVALASSRYAPIRGHAEK